MTQEKKKKEEAANKNIQNSNTTTTIQHDNTIIVKAKYPYRNKKGKTFVRGIFRRGCFIVETETVDNTL